jgi:hypothetical protein
MDFNTANKQSGGATDPIPPGTYKLKAVVRPGGTGDDGMLKLAKNLNTRMLDMEFTVASGAYAGRKLWENWVIDVEEGEPSEGMATAMEITRSRIRSLLESARGYAPDDDSPEAVEARKISSFEDLTGLTLVARVSIKSGGGTYKDKNVIAEILTPADHRWVGFNANHPRVTGKTDAGSAPLAPKSRAMDFEDDIPFAPEWRG